MDISRLRQVLSELCKGQERLLRVFMTTKEMIRGGIYKTRTKCGKKGCKCESGELHDIWVLYRSIEGKKEIRSLTKEEAFKYSDYTRNYQRYRQARAEMVKLQRRQIQVVDMMEKEIRAAKRDSEKKLFQRTTG